MMADEQLEPSTVLDAERFKAYEHSVVQSPLIEQTLERLRPNVRICDVGGATGRFLSTLEHRAGFAIDGTVLEVLESYGSQLVDSRLTFHHASILDTGLPDESFDVVTARHVLHHLVGDGIAHTRRLQQKGLEEMLRLTRRGGTVLILEQVHRVAIFSRLVFLASRLANRYRLRSRFFEAGNVVVSFLTPAEIRQMVASLDGQITEVERTMRRHVSLRWKLTLLMWPVRDALIVIRKR